MPRFGKVTLSWTSTLLFVFFLWSFLAGIDRLVWVNAGGGLIGYLGANTGVIDLPGCKGVGVEYKAAGDGSPAYDYRCSTVDSGMPYWPLQHSGRSTELPGAITKAFHR